MTNWTSHTESFNVALMLFALSMVDYLMFFPSLSTLSGDTFISLKGTWGFYLNHAIPIRLFKSVLDNVLLEHGGQPCVLPFAVHLDFGQLL